MATDKICKTPQRERERERTKIVMQYTHARASQSNGVEENVFKKGKDRLTDEQAETEKYFKKRTHAHTHTRTHAHTHIITLQNGRVQKNFRKII